MGRPPLPIGAWGEINYTKRAGKPAAYARFRDHDGRTRAVLRTGKTRAQARTALLEELADRTMPRNGEINGNTRLSELADIYQEEMMASKLADQSKLNYRSKLNTIRTGIGGIRLSEATPGRLDRFVQSVAKDYPSAAQMLRTVLKNMLSLAVLNDVFDHNPAAETRLIETDPVEVKALRAKDLHEIRKRLQAWDAAPVGKHPRNGSLTDVTDMYLATGGRTAEVLAFDWPSIDLDKDPYEVTVSKTLIKNLEGKLVVQMHTKTKLIRTLELPPSVGAMLIRRRVEATSDIVFPSSNGNLKRPDILRKEWHAALKGSKFEGLKLGVYRKAVATHIADRLGASAAREQLGHIGLAALKHYIEPAKRGPHAAAVIDELFLESAD